MFKNPGVVKDTSLSLGEIRDQLSSSIVSSVLDIKKRADARENWLKNLECIYLAGDNEEPSGKRRRLEDGSVATSFSELLRRRYLDPVYDDKDGKRYVAVSYTWHASKEEYEEVDRGKFGPYLIEPRKSGESALPSSVRNMIWKRVLRYAEHVRCENIWIDRECIDQENETEKEAAIQSMHLVYGQSKWPIALLTHTIKTVEELDLLTNLMLGEVDAEDEPALLNLLNEITSDLWWTRAWTFQEDYRASTRMTLLIPHRRSLEELKRTARDDYGRPVLGNLEGEICIKSADFRRKATEFCLSYGEALENRDICDKILRTAPKYNVLLEDERSPLGFGSVSRSMSPAILSDILSRGIAVESDRLAIMANCCGYNTRLNTKALKQDGSSLSLSILALYLLNGEIIDNNPKWPGRGTLDDNIAGYLAKQSLDNFRPVVNEGLTFIKSCRFIDPQLSEEGTRTKGHLWRLGKVIRCKPMRKKFRTLSPLEEFAAGLEYRSYGGSYTELAYELLAWTRTAPYNASRKRSRAWEWQEWMAGEVEEALLEGRALRLGHLLHPEHGPEGTVPLAIFVGDSDDDWEDETAESYAFTSTQRAPQNSLKIHKHVSLEVDVERLRSEDSSSRAPPKLYIKRWLNGLCFWEGCPRQSVVFPWPPDLLE